MQPSGPKLRAGLTPRRRRDCRQMCTVQSMTDGTRNAVKGSKARWGAQCGRSRGGPVLEVLEQGPRRGPGARGE